MGALRSRDVKINGDLLFGDNKMELVLITALGVGGATVIGAVIGFVFKNISHKFSDTVLSFAAGIMLAAVVLGLTIH